jgi:hypothetical protein
MSGSALEEYLSGVFDPRSERIVRELDRVILGSHAKLEVAIKYKILMYALSGDFQTWVCAINAGRKKVALHFLYGFMLDDPQEVLRPGSSVLMSWDFPFDGEVDEAVGLYVAEAARRNGEYKANRDAVLEAGRDAAAKGGRRPKPRG